MTGKKDNSRKAYYREFKKVIQQSDVILEILDCRDPLGCRTREVEEMIMNAGADKKIVLILNKIGIILCTIFILFHRFGSKRYCRSMAEMSA